MSKTYYNIYKDSSGNVGIGTTSPTYRLTVASPNTIAPFAIRNSSNSNRRYLAVTSQSNNPNLALFNSSETSTIELNTNGDSFLNGGNVGIGTSSPDSRFHVVNNDFVLFENTTASANSLLKLKTASRTWQMSVRESDLSGALTFRNETAGTDNLVINTSGNVGIGTTSPREKLNIDSGNFVFTASKTGDADIQSIIWHNTNSTGFDVAKIVGKTGTNIYEGIIRFETKDSGGTMAERMRIASNGNVGIGTTDPSLAKLHISGSGSTQRALLAVQSTNNHAELSIISEASTYSSYIKFQDNSGAADRYLIQADVNDNLLFRPQGTGTTGNQIIFDDSGQLGVGCTPSYKIHTTSGSRFFGGDGYTQVERNTTSTGVSALLVQKTTTGGIATFYHSATAGTPASGTATFHVNSSDSYLISNLGIGTTSPAYKLDVSGDASFNGSGSSGYVYIRGNSGLGGATTPQYKSGMIFGWNRSNGYGESNIIFTDAGAGSNVRLAIQFWDNSTLYDYVSVNSSGNVGIGSTGPINRLQVVPSTSGGSSSNASEDAAYFGGNELGGVGGYTGIRLGGFGTSGYGTYIRSVKTTSYGNYWNEAITFSVTRTNTSSTVDEVMRITSSGSVGIGTTSPLDLLHIVGSTRADFKLEGGYTSGTTDVGKFTFAYTPRGGDTNNRSIAGISAYNTTTGSTSGGFMVFSTRDTNSSSLERMRILADGQIRFNTYGSGSFTGTKAYVLAVDSSGNIIETNSGSGSVTSSSSTTNYLTKWTNGGSEIIGNSVAYDDGTNIGVGTASPSQKLHVVGKALITDDVQLTGSNPRIDFNTNGASSLRFYDTTNTAERARFNTDGNLGIGTTSPATILDIDDGAVSDIRIRGNATTNTRFAGIAFYNTAGTDTVASITADRDGANDAGLIAFDTQPAGGGNTERMRITSAGLVGIGTTSPTEELHLIKSADTGIGMEIDNGNSGASAHARIGLKNNSDDLFYILNHGSGRTAAYRYNIALADYSEILAQDSINGLLIGTGTTDNPIIFGNNNGERMRIAAGGNVGIGVTNPGSRLDVKGDIRVRDIDSDLIHGYLYSNSTEGILRINNGANWGFIARGSGNNPYIGAYYGGSMHVVGFGAADGSSINHFLTTFDFSNQRVGIGTSSPSYRLHVNGGGARIEDGETTLSPDSTSNSGISTRALTIMNLVDTGWTTDALTAYNATTSYDILNRASYSFFARPQSTNIITHCTEVNDNAHLYRFVNLNSAATEPLLRWDFYQYDGSGTTSGDFKVASQLFEIQHLGGSKLMIQGDGNVGIGTSTPDYKLDVEGGLRVYQSTSAVGAGLGLTVENAGTGDAVVQYLITGVQRWVTGIDNSDSDKFKIAKDTDVGVNAYLTIQTDGNVGIGTTSPLAKLHVSAGSQDGILLDPNNALLGKKSADNTYTQLIYWSGDIAYYGRATTAPASHSVSQHQFRTGGTTRLTLTTSEVIFNDGGYNYNFRVEGDADTNLIKTDASNDRVGIGTASPGYKLEVNGSFAATTKSFVIDHPTKEGKRLVYASLEGPENGVYVRGRGDSDVIELPDYWVGLVHEDSITVQITAKGKDENNKIRKYSVNDIVDNKVYIYTDSGDNIYSYFYIVHAERKDVDKLQVEIDK